MSDDFSNTMDLNATPGCGCYACQQAQNDTGTQTTLNETNTSIYSYDTIDATGNSAIGSTSQALQLIHGNEWGPGGGTGVTITYSFVNSVPSYYAGSAQERNQFHEFTNTMKVATREILEHVSNYVDITFTEVSGVGDMTFGQAWLTNSQSDPGAWAYYPDQGDFSGDVWVNYKYTSSFANMDGGTYGRFAMTHEIGHALGLVHTFEAFGLNLNDNSVHNTEKLSVMAYNWSTWGNTYAETLQLYDIYALQNVYGANTTYNSGATTYTLESGSAYTIYDAGGTDTFSAAHLSSGVTINLNDGEFSSVGLTENIAIAYGTIIENATGGSGNDTFYGNEYDNILIGNGGDDTFHASLGDDTINGGANAGNGDTVTYSYNIADFLISLVNSVTVSLHHIAQSFTDTISNVENFIFSGTTYTFEQVSAQAGGQDVEDIKIVVTVPGQSNYVYNSTETGFAQFSPADMNSGGSTDAAIRVLHTTTGYNLTVDNAAPDDILLYGSNANDTITVDGTQGTGALTFQLKHGDDNLTITEINTDDVIYGMRGSDTIRAGDGNDTIHGDLVNGDETWADADILHGEGGQDTIYGDGGNDELYGGDGNDDLFGGSGDDLLDGGADGDNLDGGAGNDTLIGGDGNDSIDGGDGIDTVDYSSDTGGITANLDSTYATDGFGNSDRLYNIENVIGTAFADTIYGSDVANIMTGGDGIDRLYGRGGADTLNGGQGDDQLYGDDGNDTLNGGAGNDTLVGGEGADTIDGGDDIDTVDYSAESGSINVDLETGNIFDGGGSRDTVRNIEIVIASNFADMLAGSAGADTIYGGDGIDRLYGRDGEDILYGDDGNDFIYGGNNDDDLYGGNGDDRLDGEEGNDYLAGGAGNDTLIGGNGNDDLYGGGNDDILIGGNGQDRFYGQSGIDTVDYTDDIGGISVNLNNTFQTDGWGNQDYFNSIENIIGSNFDDVITGDSGDNNLQGNNGNDTISGGGGNDIINAGGGNDTISGGAGADTLNGGDGIDTVTYASDTGGIDADMLRIRITDGSGSVDKVYNVEILIGSNFADMIAATDNADEIRGGGGNDRIYGRDGDDDLYGDLGNDIMFGGNGADDIYGGEGNDTLYGGANDDNIYGGLGNDVLYGDGGADTFVFTEMGYDNRDYLKDFNAGEGDKLDLSALLSGFDAGIDDINDFVQFTFASATKSNIWVNADGIGNDRELVLTFQNNQAGLTINDLYNNGNLIA